MAELPQPDQATTLAPAAGPTRSLQARALRLFLGVFLLLTPIIAAVLVLSALSSLQTTLRGRAELVTAGLSRSLELSVAAREGNAAAALAQVGWVKGLGPELIAVVVLRPDGAPLVGLGPEGVLDPLALERAANTTKEGGLLQVVLEEEIRPAAVGNASDDGLEFLEPAAQTAPERRGRVRVTLSAAGDVRRQVGNVLFTSLLLLLASMVALRVMLGNVLRRTRPLFDVARKMSEGNFAVRTQSEYAEMQVLVRAFDDISDSLSHMIEDVRHVADNVGEAVTDIRGASDGMRKGVEADLGAVRIASASVVALRDGVQRTADRLRALSQRATASSADSSGIADVNRGSARTLEALRGQVTRQSQSVGVLNERSRALLDDARVVADSSSRARATATQMRSSLEDAAQKSTHASELASLAVDESRQGGRAIEDAVERIREIAQQAHDMRDSLSSLFERVERMRPILQTIVDVTDSTSLLALNAGILAAQAGEHGRPFEVVVAQLRQLSAQTGELTAKVDLTVRTVLDERARTEKAATELRTVVAASIEDARRAGSALDAIRESTEKSQTVTSGIADVVCGIAREVAHTLERIAESAGAGSRVEISASALLDEARVLQEIASHVESVSGQVAQATQTQGDLAARVGDALTQVASEVRELTRLQELQQEDAAKVDRAIVDIERVAEDARERAAALEDVVTRLRGGADNLASGLGRFRTKGETQLMVYDDEPATSTDGETSI